MQLHYYHVDAFAEKVFAGNPAAVYLLDEWLDNALLQNIAAEHNLAETAFCVARDSYFELRWFTPDVEVDLCGHATLATAYVLFEQRGAAQQEWCFKTRSGDLLVSRQDTLISMDFPAETAIECSVPDGLANALGIGVDEVLFNVDYLVPLQSEAQLRSLSPDFCLLAKLQARGVIVTARCDSPSDNHSDNAVDSTNHNCDFVCRFFAPNVGINEDPVTGSAFTKLIPYWSHRLNKLKLQAKQVSARGGEVTCSLNGDRVIISGRAALFSKGSIEL